MKGGVPVTLPAPWVRGACDGGDGGGKTKQSSPSWVNMWGESASGHLFGAPSHLPPLGTRVGRRTEVGEDGGRVVGASRSALPSKRGSSRPWVRGAGLAERVRLAIVGAGAGSTWGVKKLGRIGGGGTGGAPAVPTDIVRGGGGWEGGIGMG